MARYSATESIAPLIVLLNRRPRRFDPFRLARGTWNQDVVLTKDGKTCYMTLITKDGSAAIASSTLSDGIWSRPSILRFSGTWRDRDEVLSPNGRTMVFVSDRPSTGNLDGAQAGGTPRIDRLWTVKRVGDSWGAPSPLTRLIAPHVLPSGPTIAGDGSLYFAIASGRGAQTHIVVSRLRNEEYQPAIAAPFDDGRNSSSEPTAYNTSYIIFKSTRPPASPGHPELFITFKHGDEWSTPSDMGKDIDPVGDDDELRLSVDGKTLFFSSRATFCDPSVKASASRDVRLWKVDLQPWLNTGCVGNLQGGCPVS